MKLGLYTTFKSNFTNKLKVINIHISDLNKKMSVERLF